MHLDDGRRKSSDFDHPHGSYLNPSPDPHNLKNSLRYPESTSSMGPRDSGMMMTMPPPMLSVGGGAPNLDIGSGNYHMSRPA
jgi:hypothetical protein